VKVVATNIPVNKMAGRLEGIVRTYVVGGSVGDRGECWEGGREFFPWPQYSKFQSLRATPLSLCMFTFLFCMVVKYLGVGVGGDLPVFSGITLAGIS
jgi:hypothetical protein